MPDVTCVIKRACGFKTHVQTPARRCATASPLRRAFNYAGLYGVTVLSPYILLFAILRAGRMDSDAGGYAGLLYGSSYAVRDDTTGA